MQKSAIGVAARALAGTVFVCATALGAVFGATPAEAHPVNVKCNVVPGVEAQLTSAQQFAQVQIALVTQHLESLHEDGNGDQGQGTSAGGAQLPSGASAYAGESSAVADAAASRVMATYFPQASAPARPPEYSIWSSGQAQFGTFAGFGAPSSKFSNYYGVIGIDRRFSADFKMGAAFGVASQDTSVGNDGSHVKANILTGTLYGTYRIAPHTFIDAQVGYGGGTVSTTRTIGSDGATVYGDRDASTVFGSLAISQDLYLQALKISPFLRADAYHVSLSAYSESGDPLALAYNRVSADDVVGVVGTRLEYPIATSWGVLTPRLRLEYQHSFDNTFNETINYASLIGGTPTTFTATMFGQNQFVTGAGLQLATPSQLDCDLYYEAITTSQGVQSQSVRLALMQKF